MLDESILWRKKLLLSFLFFSSKFIFSTLTSCLFGLFFNGADIKWTRFLFSIKGPTFCVPRFGSPLFFSLSPLAKTVVHQRYVVANVKKTTILVSWYWFIGQSNKEQSKKKRHSWSDSNGAFHYHSTILPFEKESQYYCCRSQFHSVLF